MPPTDPLRNLGVRVTSRGGELRVWSHHATTMELVVFDSRDSSWVTAVRPMAKGDHDVWSVTSSKLAPGARYAIRVGGPKGKTHDFDPTRNLIDPYARGLAGQVRVLSNTNALTEFLPEVLSSFLTSYPDISVDLEERLSDEIVGLIAEGSADIGIVAGTVDQGGLNTFPFRSDRFVLVVPHNHPLAGRTRIGFAEVLDYDMVGLDRASAIQRFLADKASRIGRPLRLRIQLRSFDAICRLVECNVGLGIVPETTVQRTARNMAITAVRLTDPWALRELTIVVRDIKALPPYARQLVDHLRASV